MALGGGIFTSQNKILPGTYINFVSAKKASAALSERGIATIPLSLDWGEELKIFAVTQEEFAKDSLKIFGYLYPADELKPIREIFLHARKVYFFRLNSSGVKSSNTYATAKYSGARGNSLKTIITANENSTEQKPLFDVSTYLGTTLVDSQKAVAAMSGLRTNDFVE